MWGQLSTTCSNFTEVAQWGAPSCSQPQPATDNGVRDGRSNWLLAPPTIHRAVPPELHVLHIAMRAGLQITRLAALSQPRTCDHSECQTNALPVRPLRVHIISDTLRSTYLLCVQVQRKCILICHSTTKNTVHRTVHSTRRAAWDISQSSHIFNSFRFFYYSR